MGTARQLRRDRRDRPGLGLILKIHRPQTYAGIGLGAHAVTGQLTPASDGTH
jgi:hypothetical protein